MAWYRRNARDLPWRRTRDPYKIWISEVMLQQTTVNAVIPYYHRWIERFPTIQRVAAASEQEILRLWQGLGYYSRARNIHRSAQIMVERYGGCVPADPQALGRLPGFGPYTVGAVLSIAFDQRQPIVDANVRRVVMRILAMEGKAVASRDGEIVEFLQGMMPPRNLRVFNQALMELGALVCRAREPLCLLCPWRGGCRACQQGIQELIPARQKRLLTKITAAVGILTDERQRVLIQRRPPEGLLANLWELPGGKLEAKETPDQALKRELLEELGIEVDSLRFFMNVRHFYTRYQVDLHAFFCRPLDRPSPRQEYKWVSLDELPLYPMPSGSAKIVDRLIGK